MSRISLAPEVRPSSPVRESTSVDGLIARVHRKGFVTYDELSEALGRFHELVDGCSRGACARVFLNLLCLASGEFVRVSQSGSFGRIRIYAGRHF